MKRSQDRDGSPRSKRSRSAYAGIDHDSGRDRLSPEMDRRVSSRMKPYREFEGNDMDRPRAKYREDRYDPEYPPVPRSDRTPEYRSLCISGFSSKVPDRLLKEQLYREFEKFGEMNVNVTFTNGDQRVAYINFKYPEDARLAKHEKVNKLVIFDRPVRIESVYNKIRSSSPPASGFREHYPSGGGGGGRGGYHQPSDGIGRGYHGGPPGPPYPGPGRDFHGGPPPPPRDFGPPHDRPFNPHPREGGFIPKRAPGSEKFPHHLDHIDPEDDVNATRTLFIGNLDYNITEPEIRAIFEQYGPIDEIDIKRPQRGQGNAYAFLKYYNLDMAHRAKVEMSGKYIGRFQCKIGYGKIQPSNCLWVGGLGPWVNHQTLEREFDRFGVIHRIEWPHGKNYAYVVYDNVDAATAAINPMRGFQLGGKDKRIRVDFADPSHVGMPMNDAPPPPRRDNFPSDRPKYDEPPYGGPPRDDWYGPPRDSFDSRGDRRRDDYERRDQGNGYRHPDGPRGDFEYRRSPDARRVSRSPGRPFDDYDRDGIRRREDFSPDRGGYRRNRSRSPDDQAPLDNVTSLSDLSKRLPVAWNGALVLKSSAFPARMHVVSGNVTIVDTLMRDPTSTETPTLTIKQRLRLDPSKTDDVQKRVIQAGPRNHCILLALPSTLQNYDDPGRNIQQRPLKNLVSYLKQKEAAGVISLPPYATKDKDNVGLLHAFPPCNFGYEYLLNRAPKLPADCMLDDYIVVVVVRGVA